MAPADDAFPCHLTLTIPFPTSHHAHVALRTLSVDEELSPLVRRTFSIPASESDSANVVVEYAATTNRMLRVAVNGFFDSLGVVLGVMEELDVDVVMEPGRESVEGAQGVREVEV
ncbi:Pcc1-domain-containing protein [Saccharata proteae CBS 121410]|uniref:Pcc1-domain-containing protein n=1 Tax=Saccharata proteae CBS 121410 TaxID=1314787 RepID=A0A9P4HWX9_9PEZI|nr:Pcc1-domain-containing protein [Saccharata proteae CBS 121410]